MLDSEIRRKGSRRSYEIDDPQTKEINDLKMKYKESVHKNQQLSQSSQQIND